MKFDEVPQAIEAMGQKLSAVIENIAELKATIDRIAPEYMTADGAAEYAQVSRATIYRWCKEGLPTVGTGGIIRIRRSDLDEYLSRVTCQ